MLLTALPACGYSFQLPYGVPVAISNGLFWAVWTLWWYSYSGIFFWNQGLSATHLMTFEETHGGRCCLRQSKCCITGSCNWNSFLQTAHDSQEIINNWGTIVSDEGNGCCSSLAVLVVISWLQKGRWKITSQSFLSWVLMHAWLWNQGNCQDHITCRHWGMVIEMW